MKIILKADDFWSLGPNKSYLDLIIAKGIKTNLGVVGSGARMIDYDGVCYLRKHAQYIEPFNHSWIHLISQTKKEFFNTDENYQRDSIVGTQMVIKKVFDVDYCQTIGFPANASDFMTVKILSEMPEIKNVFYPTGSHNYDDMAKIKTIIPINGYGIMEQQGQVNFIDFCLSFHHVSSDKIDAITFQLHPSAWSDNSLIDFGECCEYLKNKGHEFIFASEYEG